MDAFLTLRLNCDNILILVVAAQSLVVLLVLGHQLKRLSGLVVDHHQMLLSCL